MHKCWILLIIILYNVKSFANMQDRILKAEQDYISSRFLNAAFMFSDSNAPLIIGVKGVFSLEGEQLKANEVMPIASGTKPMTAVAILKLQEKNLLNVNDKITKYLDKDLWGGKIPDWAYKISIHNLLTHTSGLPEYFSFVKFDLNMSQKEINKAIIQFILSKPIENISSNYKYSNTNFVLLGMIIEQVTQKSLADFFNDEIFVPLDMKSTKLASFQETIRIEKNIASSNYPIRYYVTPTGGKPKFTLANFDFAIMPYADGGVVSTTKDLIKWYIALHSQKIISSKSYKLMTTKYCIIGNKNGYKTYSGYGIFITDLPDKNIMIHHPGQAIGIRSESGYIPDKNLYFAILSNIMVKIPKDNENIIDMKNPANQLDIVYFRDAIIKAALNDKKAQKK